MVGFLYYRWARESAGCLGWRDKIEGKGIYCCGRKFYIC